MGYFLLVLSVFPICPPPLPPHVSLFSVNLLPLVSLCSVSLSSPHCPSVCLSENVFQFAQFIVEIRSFGELRKELVFLIH